jgi:uncharacterized membrane protein
VQTELAPVSRPDLPSPAGGARTTFSSDFKRFFVRGLKALLPTLITLWLLVWAWNFLWTYIGRHIIWAVKLAQYHLSGPTAQWGHVDRFWDVRMGWMTEVVGVTLAVILVYVVGLFVGNLIGRTFWKLGEALVLKVPVVRAIYPAVKQVTDFFLADQRHQPFAASRVVAIQPHMNGIWSIGLVTGTSPMPLASAGGPYAGEPGEPAGASEEMLTVFCPNSPAAFSGYVMVVPRSAVVELPMTVEEAMRLFVSGGVIAPKLPAPGPGPAPNATRGPRGPSADATPSGPIAPTSAEPAPFPPRRAAG